MKAIKRFAVILTAIVSMTFAVLPGVANASNLPWDNVWASGSGCYDFSTKASAPILNGDRFGPYLGTVELRYSASCRTVWVRVVSPYVEIGGSIVRNSDGRTLVCEYQGYSNDLQNYYCLSRMLNDKNVSSYAKGYNYSSGWAEGITNSY